MIEINVEEISFSELQIKGGATIMIGIITNQLEKKEVVSDYMLCWLSCPPEIMASAGKWDDQEKEQRIHRQYEKEKLALRIVKQVKKEMHKFFCTESSDYQKQRDLIKVGINGAIISLSSAITMIVAKNMKANTISVNLITPIVTALFLTFGKMGKNITCELLKPQD